MKPMTGKTRTITIQFKALAGRLTSQIAMNKINNVFNRYVKKIHSNKNSSLVFPLKCTNYVVSIRLDYKDSATKKMHNKKPSELYRRFYNGFAWQHKYKKFLLKKIISLFLFESVGTLSNSRPVLADPFLDIWGYKLIVLRNC